MVEALMLMHGSMHPTPLPHSATIVNLMIRYPLPKCNSSYPISLEACCNMILCSPICRLLEEVPMMCHAWRGHDGINPPLDERASPWKATSSFSTPYLSSKQVSSVPVHTYVSMMFVSYRVRNISHFYT